jgi:hypothetical protein
VKQIIRIIIIVISAVILVWLAATPINSVLFKYRHHDTERLNEIYESSTPYDILFIGSSRTHTSINPKIIDSICGVDSYNAGTESGTMDDFKLTLDGYLVHHPTPKVVVLTLDLASFMLAKKIHFYPQYYPYINNNAVYSTMSDDGYNVRIIRYFPFFMITELDDFSKVSALRMLWGMDTSQITGNDFEYKGYKSNGENYIKKPELEKIKKYMVITSESINSLNQIVKTCKDQKIKLIFTYAPEYNFNLQKRRTNIDSVFALITQTARTQSIPYLRDDSLELCQDPYLFANNGHLNKKGAFVYSAILGKELNQIIKR